MPAGIIEKGNNGFFENEIEFNGKYADIADYLKELGIFTTAREIYVTAAIVGLLEERCIFALEDNTNKNTTSVFPNELSKRKTDLRLFFRIMMLCIDRPEFSIDDYKNNAFRVDFEDIEDVETKQEIIKNLKDNMAVFNAYACGGLEVLNDIFKDTDDPDKISDILHEFVYNYAKKAGLVEEEGLPDFTPTFN